MWYFICFVAGIILGHDQTRKGLLSLISKLFRRVADVSEKASRPKGAQQK